MKEYVAWDLEREHGDLGLESQNARKPPHSKLGLSLCNANSETTAYELVDGIIDNAHGSVVLAKLGLDVVHSLTLKSLANLSHIPRNVQAIIDEGIQQITQQSASQRDLALKSIAAAVYCDFTGFGTSLSTMAAVLRRRTSASRLKPTPPRSAEEVLQAAKGYLALQLPNLGYDPEFCIVPYNALFHNYVADRYNDDLMWAATQLRTSKSRSLSQGSRETDELPPREFTKNILGEVERSYAESPPAMDVSRPPLSRHESPLRRSKTDISLTYSRE